MGTFLAWLWNLIGLPGFLITTGVTFYICRPWRRQIAYVALLLLHPVHLLHGEWLCPSCSGTGEGAPSVEGPTSWPCWVCLRVNHLDGTPRGYVRWRYLRREWAWRGWHPRATSFQTPPLGASSEEPMRDGRASGM